MGEVELTARLYLALQVQVEHMARMMATLPQRCRYSGALSSLALLGSSLVVL